MLLGLTQCGGISTPNRAAQTFRQALHVSNQARAFDVVAERLRLMSGVPDQVMPITLDTELFGDLRLHGHDLWEFALWLQSEFGVQGSFWPNRYGPRRLTLAS